jgi:hypothetical protein
MVVWLLAAASTKRSVYRESRAQRLRYSILLIQTQSAFDPRVQRNAFRHRGERQQSRLFAPENPQLTRSPSSNRLC